MSEYTGCDKCKFNTRADDEFPCSRCEHNATDHYKPMTNADRIRNMTDEELAEFLINFWSKTVCDYCTKFIEDRPCNHECEQGFLEWLKAEVKGDGE